jgi:hypothetical protein
MIVRKAAFGLRGITLGRHVAMGARDDKPRRYWQKCRALPTCLAVVSVGLLSFAGCGGVDEAILTDYLDDLEFNTQQESLKEMSLGSFKVSAATRTQEGAQNDAERTWVQIGCKLYVIVVPEEESAVAAAYEQHRGVFDDMVVEVLRSSTIDELSDPRWLTIKSRILDAARPMLGGERVRQIVVNDFGWEII